MRVLTKYAYYHYTGGSFNTQGKQRQRAGTKELYLSYDQKMKARQQEEEEASEEGGD